MSDIFNITEEYTTLAGSSAATLFTGKGVLMRVVVEKSEAAAELTFTDNDGTDLGLNPDITVKGTLAYGLKLGNGCVVTASASDALVQALYTHEDQ